jgi:membrane-bound metal-dependent hydrolase YbcI (DUF457 family)
MPSPIGHVLAGLTIGIAAEPRSAPAPRTSKPRLLPLASALVAALPDADLLVPGFHRAATHSLGMTALVIIVTMVVTRQVTGTVWWRLALVLGAAHASHVGMDWLGVDPSRPSGIEALWPFSSRFYVSGADWFPATERRIFTVPNAWAINVRAFVVEVVTLVPVLGVTWWTTRTRRIPVPTSGQDVRQRPFA